MQTIEEPSIYRIEVEGKLHKRWSDWFSGMEIVYRNESTPKPVTILRGLVSDQSALRGMLVKLWDLNLILVAVVRIDAESYKEM